MATMDGYVTLVSLRKCSHEHRLLDVIALQPCCQPSVTSRVSMSWACLVFRFGWRRPHKHQEQIRCCMGNLKSLYHHRRHLYCSIQRIIPYASPSRRRPLHQIINKESVSTFPSSFAPVPPGNTPSSFHSCPALRRSTTGSHGS